MTAKGKMQPKKVGAVKDISKSKVKEPAGSQLPGVKKKRTAAVPAIKKVK